ADLANLELRSAPSGISRPPSPAAHAIGGPWIFVGQRVEDEWKRARRALQAAFPAIGMPDSPAQFHTPVLHAFRSGRKGRVCRDLRLPRVHKEDAFFRHEVRGMVFGELRQSQCCRPAALYGLAETRGEYRWAGPEQTPDSCIKDREAIAH